MSLTPEQIAEALKSKEAKDAIAAAVEEQVKGLKDKRDELLGSVRELKDRLKEIEADKEAAEEKAAANSGDIEKIKAQLEAKHKKELDALTESNKKLNGQLEKHVIGEGLTNALIKAKIAPQHMEAVTALLRTKHKAEVGDNDGTPFAKLDGKSVDEFVGAWAQSDAGKNYVTAGQNSGGGSNGANDGGKAPGGDGKKPTMNRKDFDALPIMEQVKAAKNNVIVD